MTATRVGMAGALCLLVWGSACNRTTPPVAQAAAPAPAGETKPVVAREIRLTGLIIAVHSSKILVPQIYGDGSPLTLTELIANGAKVKEGEQLAAFDPTSQMDKARDASAKADDLGHQADQKIGRAHV